MLDIKRIREKPDELETALVNRGQDESDARAIVGKIIGLDAERRALLSDLQEAQARRNTAGKQISQALVAKDVDLAAKLKEEMSGLKTAIQEGENRERELDHLLAEALATVPNIPLEDVPVGSDETDNIAVRYVGEKPEMGFAPKEHFDIGIALGLPDFERAAKVDLEYLRSRHYVGRFDFEWPSTAVGKHSLRPMDKDFRSSVLRP